jgi:hypothetical protein
MAHRLPQHSDEFEDRYASKHLPPAARMPKVQRFEASGVAATPTRGEDYVNRSATGCVAHDGQAGPL